MNRISFATPEAKDDLEDAGQDHRGNKVVEAVGLHQRGDHEGDAVRRVLALAQRFGCDRGSLAGPAPAPRRLIDQDSSAAALNPRLTPDGGPQAVGGGFAVQAVQQEGHRPLRENFR